VDVERMSAARELVPEEVGHMSHQFAILVDVGVEDEQVVTGGVLAGAKWPKGF
jgi:hypothetical protein